MLGENSMDPAINSTPPWNVKGDWFDVCSCNIPCPCTFAQPPTSNPCNVIFVYRITQGKFGDINIAGFNVVIVAQLNDNMLDGGTLDAGIVIDASANKSERDALLQIFSGQAGGWLKQYLPPALREVKGIQYAEIKVNIDESLESWCVEVKDTVYAKGIALTGPTADPSKRVQMFNPPGSEVGPTTEAVTWGKSIESHWDIFGFNCVIPTGRNSKHIPFEWTGPSN